MEWPGIGLHAKRPATILAHFIIILATLYYGRQTTLIFIFSTSAFRYFVYRYFLRIQEPLHNIKRCEFIISTNLTHLKNFLKSIICIHLILAYSLCVSAFFTNNPILVNTFIENSLLMARGIYLTSQYTKFALYRTYRLS